MNLVRNSAVIAALTLFSRVLGFLRDVILFAALGAGPVADAFLAALRFPNLFRRLFAEGAFAQAFVPVYTKTLAGDGAERADRMASEALSVLVAVTALLSALAILAMPQINLLLFAGYADQPEVFALATLLTRITMPYLVAMTLATLFGAMLNARGRFALAAAAQSVLNITMLAALSPIVLRLLGAEWIPAWSPEQAAVAAALAVTAAGVLQAGMVWLGARRQGAHTRLGFPRLTPDVRRLIGLAVPGAIAGSAVQVNLLVSQALASFEEGAISYLNAADRLYQLPLGMIGIAIGVAMVPRLSRLVQAGDQTGARSALDEAVSLSMAFTLPACAAFLLSGFWIMDAAFTRGAFAQEDARAAADALFHYAWGLPAFVLAKIYAPGFFAREDTKAPMRFAVISMVLNVAFGAGLFFLLRAMGEAGFVGLAIGTSLAGWANVALMVRSLAMRGAYRPSADALGRLGRVGLATAGMGALLWLAQTQRHTLELLLGSKELALAVAVLGGGASYAVLAFAFGAVRPSELRSALRRERGAPPATPAIDS